MRILHTSDWHLGRSFHGVDLTDAQGQFVEHLLETVRAEQVDVVLVSGDVYDRALPPVRAVELADETFSRLASSGVRTVVTSGNHDSPVRLGNNARLADRAGVHFRTRWQEVDVPVTIEDREGPVHFYGIPYLEPDAVRMAWSLGSRTHEAALAAAMERIHTDLDARGGRSVVMAHAFVAGSPEAADSMTSDSERDISVGGLAIAPTHLFTRPDYVALGHLHGAAQLTESVRYSGAPLAYSFSEAGHTKGSWLAEIDAPRSAPRGLRPRPRRAPPAPDRRSDRLAAHRPRRWLTPRAATWRSRSPTRCAPRRRWSGSGRRFPHVLALAFEPEGRSQAPRPPLPRVSGRSDHDIALGFVEEVRRLEATTEEALLLQLACDSCSRSDDRDADPVDQAV